MAVIICPECSARYRMSDSQIAKAKKLRCKKCNTVFQIQESIDGGVQAEEYAQPSETVPIFESSPTHDDLLSPDIGSGDITLDFTSSAESETAPTLESLETHEDISLPDTNLESMTLEFDSSQVSAPPVLDFSFSAVIPEDQEIDEDDDGEIRDHITGSFKQEEPQDDGDLVELSDEGESQFSSSETQSLDFSFSAQFPATEEVEEQEEDIESSEDEDIPISSETEEAPEEEAPEEEALIGEAEDYDEAEIKQEEELDTCCVDSLAMGLPRCEICGRNLEGRDQAYAQELKQQRREQLKEGLIQSDVQVGFTEEQGVSEDIMASPVEDFSDVELALDALADGSFHKIRKRQEAKKTFVKTAKLVVLASIAGILLLGGVIWFLRPDPHKKLVSRYEQLTSNKEVDVGEFVALFLDAAIEQDREILQQLSVMETTLGITYGKVIGIEEGYEETSVGRLGNRKTGLEQEIASLEQKIDTKTALLNDASARNLSSRTIEEDIKTSIRKIQMLQTEFEQEDAEIKKKLVRLQKELEKVKQEIVKNRAIERKYMDAVDQVGKALYKSSQTKQKQLVEKQTKIESQIQQEETVYQQRKQELDAQYEPRFTELNTRLESQKVLLEEAKLLEDSKKSPVTLLSKEIERMTKTLADKRNELTEVEKQFAVALKFFTNDQEKRQILQSPDTTEFSYLSKHVAVSIKAGGRSEQQVSIVLKRYRALVEDQTFESDWFVETIAK